MANSHAHPNGRLQPGRLRQSRQQRRRVSTWRCTATSRSSRRWCRSRAPPSFSALPQELRKARRAAEAAWTLRVQPPVTPDPHARLHDVAADVSSSLEFFSGAFGPPALNTLTVSPIPGSFGQGFPGPGVSFHARLSGSQPAPCFPAWRRAPGVFLRLDHAPRSRAPVVGQRGDYRRLSGRMDARSAVQLLRAAVAGA